MPDRTQSTSRSRRSHGPAPAWLRLASVCVVLIAVPVGLYLFLYQRSRIEDATIRSFRALATAADRVDEVLVRLPNVVGSSSFGVSPTMLDEVTKRLTGEPAGRTGCGSDRGAAPPAWKRPPEFPYHLLRSRRATDAQRLDYRYWLAAHVLFESDKKASGATEALWNQLHCLIDTHRKFAEPSETVKMQFDPMPRTALRPRAPECAEGLATAKCIRLRELLEAAPCAESAPSPRLRAGRDGMQATVADCRRLEERSSELHRALNSFRGSEGVIRAVDLFGIRSAADLDELMNEATGYLSRFFDSHLIADAVGLILFEAETATASEIEVDETRVETPGFSRYVDISELLRGESSAVDGAATVGGASMPAATGTSFRGRSFVRIVGVEDIRLRVFVQPFILDGVAVADGGSQSGSQARAFSSRGVAQAAVAARAARPTFYLVGVVDDREFRSAAIRLRLRMVTDATLVLLTLLTLAPIVWFWTAGDRVVVGRFALLGVCALPVVGVVLSTVVAGGVIAHRLDEHALDRAMEHVSDRIAELFDRELSGEIGRLQRAVPRLLARDRRDEPPRRGGKVHLPRTIDRDERRLTELETAFYCDDADRNVDYDPGRPEAWSASLLNAEGRQRVCLSAPGRARPARTPPLDLPFRDYFAQPKDGVLWRSPPPAVLPRPISCRFGGTQDEESLIPCLVDDLPEPSKRPFGVPGAPGRTPGGIEAPYFLERIDSVIGGQLETVLAIHSGVSAKPVAVAAVSLNALDRAVPPRHMEFAVVDRETGRTLFHSDDDLAMTTYFAEDTGRDPAFRSLLRSGARDTIELDYAGVPVRAHVRPLRLGLPWTLVVYRGHELQDRLGGLTAALAIFFTLLCLFLAALAGGLVLLAARWLRPPGALPGLPAVIGRVMAVASGLRGAAVPAALAALLLGFAGFSRLASIQPAGWRVLPFFAVCSVVSVAILVAGCGLVQRGATRAAVGGDHTTRRVFGLAVLIVAVAVLPSALWFGHHRSTLGFGLNHYLMDATLDSVDRAREDYRRDSLQAHGAATAPVGDRARGRWREEPEPEPGWVHRALRPIVATSALANQLMAYRARPVAVAGGASSLHDVFADTFDYPITSPPRVLSAGDFGRILALVMGSLLFAALLAVHAYSICAACTVVGRRRRGLAQLPSAGALKRSMQGRPAREPLYAIVVHRSERGSRDFVDDLTAHLRLSWRYLRAKRPAPSRPGHDDRSGRDADSTKDGTLWVVEDLEEALEQGAEGRALFDELERVVNGRQHVLIGSRVLPHYHQSDRAGRRFDPGHDDDDALLDWRSGLAREFQVLDRWFDHADDADRHDRWSKLVRKFRVFVLDDAGAPGPSLDGLAGTTDAHAVVETMQEEADANPDLRRVARNVSAEVLASVAAGAVRSREAGALAIARFGKAAASCFRRFWTESTHDEQLQLYALARGGVVDSRRTAALSSLVNRGIVRENLETGVVELRSEAFREFIEDHADRGELEAWRKKGDGGAWRFFWPPLAIGGVLGLAFLAMSNPEMRATLLTTLLGLLPAALPLLGARSGGSPGAAGGSGA